ncbi:MAG: hypothetical protein E7488_04125 [Ruminococcaceae bacterium]|nr:hypothetical protein [Oscillospiraceae bacterium]
MISDSILRIIMANNHHTPFDIDHFSIQRRGSKFYVYAHPFENNFNKKKIGTFADYESAKAAVDSILDLKLPPDINI